MIALHPLVPPDARVCCLQSRNRFSVRMSEHAEHHDRARVIDSCALAMNT